MSLRPTRPDRLGSPAVHTHLAPGPRLKALNERNSCPGGPARAAGSAAFLERHARFAMPEYPPRHVYAATWRVYLLTYLRFAGQKLVRGRSSHSLV